MMTPLRIRLQFRPIIAGKFVASSLFNREGHQEDHPKIEKKVERAVRRTAESVNFDGRGNK
jgi:hypothetical protein